MALENFLKGEQAIAQDAFSRIVEQYLDQDWSPFNKKIIFNSFFRLAQLDSSRSEYWIQKAIEFDLEQTPDNKIVSPPLFETWIQLKKRDLIFWNPGLETQLFDSVFINGREYSLENMKPISLVKDAKYRVTFISNSGDIKTQKLDTSELLDHKWEHDYKLRGNCRDYFITDKSLVDSKFRGLFSSNCLVHLNFRDTSTVGNHSYESDSSIQTKRDAFEASQKSLNKNPINFKPELDFNSSVQSPTYINTQLDLKPKSEFSNWIKNPWIWLGVGVVGYWIYSENQKDDNDTVQIKVAPSQKSGFD
jgi:hypothetical protein